MRVLIEKDDGTVVEVKGIETVSKVICTIDALDEAVIIDKEGSTDFCKINALSGVEVKEIETVSNNSDRLLLLTNMYLTPEHKENCERELSAKLKKECIILPQFITSIYRLS